MRVNESIAELRQICQESRASIVDDITWWERNFPRRFSIYLTRLFLEIGISANQVTLISLIVGIIGGVFLTFPSPYFWFIGIASLGLWYLLDHADGEVARYNRIASPEGVLWDVITGWFVLLFKLTCLSFGIYHALDSAFPLIFGFLAVVSYATTTFTSVVPYNILHMRGLLPEALATYKDKDTRLEENTNIVRRFFQNIWAFLFVILLGSIADCFISPFTIGSVSFNARYICFIIFNLAWLEFAIERIYRLIHSGVKLF